MDNDHQNRIEALENEIVELWHESEAGRKPLHEYLHMTEEQYAAWAVHATPVIKSPPSAMDNNRAFASHRATLASPQAPTGLGHSEGIANAGDFEAWIPFSVRMAITRAISDPGAIVGPRLSTDNCYEQMAHWQGRAALEAMLRCAVSSPQLAQAIEARRAETLGSVHESAVHAPKTPQGTDK